MRRVSLWLGVLTAAALLVLFFIFVRGMGISALRTPSAIEDRIANTAWRFLVPREISRAANPVSSTPDGLQASLRHYADHCAVCHANDGGGDTPIGRRVFPPVPDLRGESTQRLTDGELFYAIEQGIPFTAMPGWSTGTIDGERQSWELVRFVRHLPSLTPGELKELDRLTPRSPANEERDREIEDFLRGGTSGRKP